MYLEVVFFEAGLGYLSQYPSLHTPIDKFLDNLVLMKLSNAGPEVLHISQGPQ